MTNTFAVVSSDAEFVKRLIDFLNTSMSAPNSTSVHLIEGDLVAEVTRLRERVAELEADLRRVYNTACMLAEKLEASEAEIERLRAEVARCHRELERVSDHILATDMIGDRARAKALAVCRAAKAAIKAMA